MQLMRWCLQALLNKVIPTSTLVLSSLLPLAFLAQIWCGTWLLHSLMKSQYSDLVFVGTDDCWAALERDDEVPFDELPWSDR